jgi:hypothetical protein
MIPSAAGRESRLLRRENPKMKLQGCEPSGRETLQSPSLSSQQKLTHNQSLSQLFTGDYIADVDRAVSLLIKPRAIP